MAYWNLGQLARAISPLFVDAAPLQAGLARFGQRYAAAEREVTAGKLGLGECRDQDLVLIRDLHALLHAHEIDMTLWFRRLADVDPHAPSLEPLEVAFYDPVKRAAGAAALDAWLARYAARVREDAFTADPRRESMRAANPAFVLRNWVAQEAIDRATAGDTGAIGELLEIMRRPYEDQPENGRLGGKRPEWAKDKAGCSMLSCSS